MPLKLAHESKIVDQQEFDGGAIKGKQAQLQSGKGKDY